jgi:hypothetical protein
MGDFEMGDIPLTEEEQEAAKKEEQAAQAKLQPVLPAQSQSGGLMDGLKKEQAAAGKKQVAANDDAVLKTKVRGGQIGLNTKGMNGAQKWRAALQKVEEVELTESGEKERFYDGPGAKEVSYLHNRRFVHRAALVRASGSMVGARARRTSTLRSLSCGGACACGWQSFKHSTRRR